MAKYDPICEVCHRRPKMDRSACCEDCWYSGSYSQWASDQAVLRDGGAVAYTETGAIYTTFDGRVRVRPYGLRTYG